MVIEVINDQELFFMPRVKLTLDSSAHCLRPEEENILVVQQRAGS